MICKRPILRVERGDCLGHLATDHAPDDAGGTAPLGRAHALRRRGPGDGRDDDLPGADPDLIAEWRLSHAEAGWISGVAYAGYMAGVPLLVTLTDRIDARRMVIGFSLVACLSSLGYALFAEGIWSALLFRVLNGLALAGTYMPGLKALTDQVAGP